MQVFKSVAKGADNGVLQLKKSSFWTVSIVQCFLKNTFRKLDLFPSLGKIKVAPIL
jgi:hypothetical protein